MSKIICAGLIAVDLVFELPAFPTKGTKARAKTSHIISGGGAMNAASAIAKLGGDVELVGAVGDDLFGSALHQKMSARGIGSHHVQTLPNTATSRSAILISPDGDRTIINHRDSSIFPDHFTMPGDEEFDGVLVDTRWPTVVAQIVEAARAAGKPAVIDAEAPIAPALRTMSAASHVVFSEQGLSDFIGAADGAALAAATAQLGGWCAVTRGPASVLCHDGSKLTEVPAYPAKALNTLGAGDAWHGAFVLALVEGREELEAVRWANVAAARKVVHPAGQENWPNAAEVAAHMVRYQPA